LMRSLSQRWRGTYQPLPRGPLAVAASVGVLLVVAFWLLRNLSAGAWLAP
jgi:hypothetical protein